MEEQSTLMDPASPEFQSMLDAARTKGEEQLGKPPDTTVSESQTEEKIIPGSSPEGTQTKADEEETDDVEILKNRVRGLKAEMSRIRNQRSASEGEASALKERLANLEGRLQEIKEAKPLSQSAADSLKKLDDTKLIELHTAYEDELADARAVARQAERDGDREVIQQANQRIDNARKMLNLMKAEEQTRVKQSARAQSAAEDEQTRLSAELEGLFADVFKAAPELADKNSDLWKAGQEEYKKLPTLTKRLGPIGELIATAAAISKNPQLVGKKAGKSLEKALENIESVADKAFNKGGAAPQAGVARQTYNLNTHEDIASFEEQVRRVKMG